MFRLIGMFSFVIWILLEMEIINDNDHIPNIHLTGICKAYLLHNKGFLLPK